MVSLLVVRAFSYELCCGNDFRSEHTILNVESGLTAVTHRSGTTRGAELLELQRRIIIFGMEVLPV